jgi:hypothetical protein
VATIGVDCDIKLTHALVNGGEPVGFVLKRARETVSGLVTLRRQAYRDPEGYYVDRLVFWMTLLVADQLLNPDGSRHPRTRAQITPACWSSWLRAAGSRWNVPRASGPVCMLRCR